MLFFLGRPRVVRVGVDAGALRGADLDVFLLAVLAIVVGSMEICGSWDFSYGAPRIRKCRIWRGSSQRW